MQRRWLEPGILGALFASAAALWAFIAIADEVIEGDTGSIDTWILVALHPQNPSDGSPGPRWLWEFARDISGFGSVGVLALIVLATCVLLVLVGRNRAALFVLSATLLSSTANALLKFHFNRPRPTLIDHDLYVASSSFPSGHAMIATTVYLTLGAVLARMTGVVRLKLYILSIAVLLSGLVGLSRVYLGVHWPSDVLAGWAAGAGWALGAWGIARYIHLGKDAAP